MLAIPKVKPYKRKLRRHNDSIICLYSSNGMQGSKLISGSADQSFRGTNTNINTNLVWDLKKKKIKRKHQLVRPDQMEIQKIKFDLENCYEDPDSDTLEDEKDVNGLSEEKSAKLYKVTDNHNIFTVC